MTPWEIFIVVLTSVLMFFGTLMASIVLLECWDRFLMRRLGAPVQRYLQLGMDETRLTQALRFWSLSLAAITIILGFMLNAWPLAITFAGMMSFLPHVCLDAIIQKRELLLEEQLINAATVIANSVKASLGISDGLRALATEAAVPIRREFRRIIDQFDHGRPLGETLAAARKRLELEPFSLFCLALEVADQHAHGSVNFALERLSQSLQDWFRIRRKLHAETSSSRYAILIMACCPVAFFVLFLVTGTHSVLFLLTTFIGQIVTSVILILICFGIWWARRITKIAFA